MDDASLLAASATDPEAFAAFYDRYERLVAAYLARKVGDPELVGDLTAEVFAAALGAAGRYRAVGPTAAGWLLTIAHNKLMKSLRRGRVEAAARRRLGVREPIAFDDEQLERVENELSRTGVLELLEGLPPEQAEAIRARILEEREYGEIASRMLTSELVVRKRVSRGLRTLRNQTMEGSK